MHYILKTKKAIALLLIVSQLIVNAGMQTFAVSFSKIVDNTLDAMQQPENISTKYYEKIGDVDFAPKYARDKTYQYNTPTLAGIVTTGKGYALSHILITQSFILRLW